MPALLRLIGLQKRPNRRTARDHLKRIQIEGPTLMNEDAAEQMREMVDAVYRSESRRVSSPP